MKTRPLHCRPRRPPRHPGNPVVAHDAIRRQRRKAKPATHPGRHDDQLMMRQPKGMLTVTSFRARRKWRLRIISRS
jgi:hypothetical protein